jgi:hypothetical protein
MLGLYLAVFVWRDASSEVLKREFVSDWFDIDTRIDGNGTNPISDENASGHADGPRFTLDTRGEDEKLPDTNQSGHADGPRFTLDTRGEDEEEEQEEAKSGHGDGPRFTLDT